MKTTLACRSVPLGLSLLFLSACAKRETPLQAGIRTQTLHLVRTASPAGVRFHK